MKTPRWFRFVLFLLPLYPSGVGAQEGPSLSRVESLIEEGQILRAREVLEVWWERLGHTVDREARQRSLWLRARLTVDPSMAELDLRRLVLEFPGGDFSDDALLRLAQAAEIRGDRAQAHGHYSALVRGYPSSPHVSLARGWLSNAGPEVEALAAATNTHEEDSSSTLLVSEGAISIQLGAFRSLDGARSLETNLRGAGFNPRIVTVAGSDLFRVRIGHFPDREEAGRLRRTLARAGFESTIATDVQAEERVR